MVGIGFLGFVLLVAVYGELLDPYPVRAFPCLGICDSLAPFLQAGHIFGTYPTGQDVFSEVAHGASSDLLIGFGATAIALVAGLLIGVAAGFGGGGKGAALLGVTQLFLIMPSFVIVVWFYRSYGSTNLFAVPLNTVYLMALLGAFSWPPVAMVMRNEVIRTKAEEFVLGARSLGATSSRLMFRHIIPNVVTPLIGVVGVVFAANITAEALFTYLGLVNPSSDVVTWGFLIWEGQRYLTGEWWVSFFPGLMLVLTTVGVTLLGDVVSDELNPKLRAMKPG
jgi:peptide/nickel transport system permease protein